jgi:hypothetical protein
MGQMPPADATSIDLDGIRYWLLLLLASERDAALLYTRLAWYEPGERREIIAELADVERRHAAHWESKLTEAGVPVPIPVDPAFGRLIAVADAGIRRARCCPWWSVLSAQKGRIRRGRSRGCRDGLQRAGEYNSMASQREVPVGYLARGARAMSGRDWPAQLALAGALRPGSAAERAVAAAVTLGVGRLIGTAGHI